ncbi:uncharacterized protein CXorf49 homolog [Talpa occidentalis]|uniref:uncharacterized protein CXorf49 homolog n=1 Tax=Talpa occidentalis TaxID=50954 RepID=UPI00188F4504|nr:uncharacterized protein CXorf49 homolog [Talpa occidentalis]
MALGRLFPPWGLRVQAAPLEPAGFPPICGVQLLGRSKKQSPVPWATKQSKRAGVSGKKSGARKPRELEPVVAGEENDPDRGPVPKGQLPAQRSRSSLSMHRGQFSIRDRNTRAPQALAISQLLVPSQGDVMLRGPTASDDQEPPDHPPRPERQPPAAQGCPQCVTLQKEIEELRAHLGKQSLADKSQTL